MGDGDNFDGASFHPVDDEAGSEESAPFELCGVSCDLNQAAESLHSETVRYQLI